MRSDATSRLEPLDELLADEEKNNQRILENCDIISYEVNICSEENSDYKHKLNSSENIHTIISTEGVIEYINPIYSNVLYPTVVDTSVPSESSSEYSSIAPVKPQNLSKEDKQPRRKPRVSRKRRRTRGRKNTSRGENTASSEGDNHNHQNAIQTNNNETKEKKEEGPLITIHNYLNPEILNRIDVLEYKAESEKPKPKRKRTSTLSRLLAAGSTTIVTTRKRAAAAEFGGSLDSDWKSTKLLKMSLYDRRYQNDDNGSSGRTGNVSNGYSSTRNSSGISSTIQSEIDSQEQYYISGTNSSVSNGNMMAQAPSMATLCNIGNTCYLNSVLYTLRFAPQFLHNLHHLMVDLAGVQQFVARQKAKTSLSLNSSSHFENSQSWSNKVLIALESVQSSTIGSAEKSITKSNQQLLAEKLHEVYQNLHRKEIVESTEPFHADILLHAIQEVNTTFEGNQQQDAHEFLMCLLNAIRDTSQTLIKLIDECPDVIANGYLCNVDDIDGCFITEQNSGSPINQMAPTSLSNNGSSSSSPSTSNIKSSFIFSRKPKRKEDSKNSKNLRIQSPLKDSSNNISQSQHLNQQPQSNSLFYLNTVDLSGSSSSLTTNNTFATQSSSTASTSSMTSLTGIGKITGSDDDALMMPSAKRAANILRNKESLTDRIRELGLDFFNSDFEGVTVSTTKCLSCETITKQKEIMIDISVPVPIAGYENTDYALEPSSYIQNSCVTREYFRGDNKYRCEKCTGYTEAIRSVSFEVLPRLLIIQLSRFSGGMEKISSYIPTTFTLQCFCAKCYELSEDNKLHIYKLYSVITHVGATMSVGHYIAYTCSLEWANEYMNCPKDRRSPQSGNASSTGPMSNGLTGQTMNNGSSSSMMPTQQQLQQQQQQQQQQSSSMTSSAASSLASSGTSLMKKMKFGRSKASSSGDMSKNIKNLNGINSKTITNGIGKLSMNATCQSLSCCATRLCGLQQQHHQQQYANSNSNSNSDLLSEDLQQNGGNSVVGISGNSSAGGGGGGSLGPSITNVNYNNGYPSGYGSTGRGASKHNYNSNLMSSSSSEPIWYMCDDDKIKAMSQREFEDLLSPSRKITITPYLLFYARYDLKPNVSKQEQPQHSGSVGAGTAGSQSSWSNENPHGVGLHKI